MGCDREREGGGERWGGGGAKARERGGGEEDRERGKHVNDIQNIK